MKQYLTAEQFEEKIKNDFDNLTDEKFEIIIRLSLLFSKDTNDFIYGIAETCSKTNNLTFKQYKALSAFLSKVKKENNTKTFNKVSSVLSKSVVEQPTIKSWDSGGWKPNGKYQQPINRKKF